MRRRVASILIALLGGARVFAQSAPARSPAATQTAAIPVKPGGFVARWFVTADRRMPYQLFAPAAYDGTQTFPLIIALHGSNERGTDGRLQMSAGWLPSVAQAQAATFPALAVFPQLPDHTPGPQLSQLVIGLLDEIVRDYRVDTTRIYLTGFSLGGILTYDIAFRQPNRFAALVPIAATVQTNWLARDTLRPPSREEAILQMADRLRTTPIWAFHGTDDPNVSFANAQTAASLLSMSGVPIKFTEFPGQGHNVWSGVYAMPGLYEWLFAQHR